MTVPRDAGRVSLFLAIALTALLAVIAVSYDAAGQLRTLNTAQLLAAEAARAGGQPLDVDVAAGGGRHQVAVEQAEFAIHAYLDAAGVDPNQREITFDTDLTEVTVVVYVTYRPVLLGAFGYGEREVHGSATGALIAG